MNRQILVFVCALTLATRVQIGAIDLNRPLHEHDYEQEQEYGKTQKYTCPMHPEVITDHPGNCPKCGMKLVPRKADTHQSHTSHLSAVASAKEDQSHMSHGVHQHDHGKMQMEMHSTIDLAEPMSREGS